MLLQTLYFNCLPRRTTVCKHSDDYDVTRLKHSIPLTWRAVTVVDKIMPLSFPAFEKISTPPNAFYVIFSTLVLSPDVYIYVTVNEFFICSKDFYVQCDPSESITSPYVTVYLADSVLRLH